MSGETMTGRWLLSGILLVATLSPCLATSRYGRAYSEFLPPVVRPQGEQVVVEARKQISLTCEGHKPVVWNPPASVAMSSRYNKPAFCYISCNPAKRSLRFDRKQLQLNLAVPQSLSFFRPTDHLYGKHLWKESSLLMFRHLCLQV